MHSDVEVLLMKNFPRNNQFVQGLKEEVRTGKNPTKCGLSQGACSILYDESFRLNIIGRINLCLIAGEDIPESIQDEAKLFKFLSNKQKTGIEVDLVPLEVEDAFSLRAEDKSNWRCKRLVILHNSVNVRGDIGSRWLTLHMDRRCLTEKKINFIGSIFPRDFFYNRVQFHLAIGIKS